ncbi:hypothetical protein JX265_000402 [Neoarthrinium moseri]|uniref:SnoaL-like domain-containing protein n=1 Tax=Neoarthrinium moseri TaxID=1658444 RepID=A0A9P9WYG6_9PEZI|nr:uncharacterized protein JN550_000652 [Neoarthrinium moseri]KAI1851364.1 hypothetical protein JX266_003439 [Neoarthrinium moseri]KAI1878470.1 hypothetical protein JN550_000652 [Neoarthrinium moseri]KAI1881576.1 hypothetical protein JX265_000402 [Neoarthrinium moseri]
MIQMHSARIETATRLLDGYSSLSVPTLLETLADNFRHRILPESLDMPIRDKEAFAQHAMGVFGIFEKFQMIPVSVYEDEEADVVVVHAHMRGTLKAGPRDPWENECVMVIHLSADGNKVVEISEFVDSTKAVQMRQKHASKVFASNGQQKAVLRDTLVPDVKQIAVLCIAYHILLIVSSRLFGLSFI